MKTTHGIHPTFQLVRTLTLSLAIFMTACEKDEDATPSIPETNKEPTASEITGNVFEPALVPATNDRIAQLKLPAGFTITKFADSLTKPRMLIEGQPGMVYVTSREAGTVTLLRDADKNGMAGQRQVVARIKGVHGLTIHADKLYLVAINEVYVAQIQADGTLTTPQLFIDKLPDAGQHPNRTLAFGPDGMLYITVGSTCNACAEPDKENATILRFNPDGTGRTVFASGLRNTIGIGWHPQTKELYGFDHGIDWLGDEQQPEELNLIRQGGFYGWPYIYGDGKYNPHPRPMGDTTYAQILAKTVLPSLMYDAHAAPMAMIFYTGSQFPVDYQQDAIVAMRGSWNRSQPSGYKLIRVHFENGKPVRTEDFVSGFLVDNNRSQFGRPVGLSSLSDGSILFTDDTNGVIYRVSYKKP